MGCEILVAMNGASHFKAACKWCALLMALLVMASGCGKPGIAPAANPPAAQQEPNVTGTWDINYCQGTRGTLELIDKNGVITGTFTYPPTNKKCNVHGIRVNSQINWGFSCDLYSDTYEYHETYKGQIDGNRMSGSLTFNVGSGPQNDCLWTATKE
jgi:hypothetical protein